MKYPMAWVAIFALSACVSTKDTMQEIMSSWVGEDIDSVIEQWGYPDEKREVAGRELYVWHQRSSVNLAERSRTEGSVDSYGNYSERTVTTGGGVWEGYCGRILEVDDKGTVIKWEWKGNDCPFMEAGKYEGWRNK